MFLLGQQKLGFEIREPGGHHEVIGGDFEAQFPRGVDIGEILLGEVEDGNLGQVDFLGSRQDEKQVERAFEAVELKEQNVGLVFRLKPLRRFAPAGFRQGKVRGFLLTVFVAVAHAPFSA